MEPAADQLRADEGIMTTDGFSAVLEAGRNDRLAYNKERSYGFLEEDHQPPLRPFANVLFGESMTRGDVVSSPTQDFGPDIAEELFYRAVDRALLDEHDGSYVIPIPSMHTWLKVEFASGK